MVRAIRTTAETHQGKTITKTKTTMKDATRIIGRFMGQSYH